MENMQNLFLSTTSTSTTTSSSRSTSKSARYKCSNQFGRFTADHLVGHFGSVCGGGQAFLNFDFFLKNSQKFSDFHSKRGVGKALLYEKKTSSD